MTDTTSTDDERYVLEAPYARLRDGRTYGRPVPPSDTLAPLATLWRRWHDTPSSLVEFLGLPADADVELLVLGGMREDVRTIHTTRGERGPETIATSWSPRRRVAAAVHLVEPERHPLAADTFARNRLVAS